MKWAWLLHMHMHVHVHVHVHLPLPLPLPLRLCRHYKQRRYRKGADGLNELNLLTHALSGNGANLVNHFT